MLLAPQVKQALWVLRECQENLEQKVLEGSQDQWLVNSPASVCLGPNVPEGQLLPSLLLFQGEQGSPGPAGQKGPPGPIVSWQCLHVSISGFHLSSQSSPPPPPHSLFYFSFICRDPLVCLVCVEIPVPKEKKDTQVLSVSLDPQENRVRRETEVCLGPMDPMDQKERL